jgi:hypothetical protein
MTPAGGSGVDLESVVGGVEARPIQRTWDRRATRTSAHVRACAWCKRIRVGSKWMEVEDALEPLKIFDMEQLPQITHGICRACRRAMEMATAADEGRIGDERGEDVQHRAPVCLPGDR